MEHVIAAFPKRPLRIDSQRQTMAARILAGFGFLVLAGIYVADLMYVMPSIIDDVRYRNAPYVAGKFEDGSCQSKAFVSICDLKVKYRPNGDAVIDKELHYLLMIGDIDDNRAFVVHMDPANPDHIATSWGESCLTNRIVSQLIILGFGAFLVGAGVMEMRRRKQEATARERIGQRPQATVVALIEGKRDARSGITTITYKWEPAGKPQQKKKTRFLKGSEPFFVGTDKLLALTDGTDVTLLDNKLTLVDLTQNERDTVLKAASQPASATT